MPKIKKIYVWTNLVRPVSDWKPDSSRTILYLKFENNLNDSSWNNVSVSWAWIGYGTAWNLHYVTRTWSASGTYIKPPQTLLQTIWSWDFTISFWGWAVNWTSSEYPWFFANEYDNSSPWYWIYITWHFWSANPSELHFRNAWGSANDYLEITKSSVTRKARHHLAVTRISGVCYFYVDGELAGSWTNTRNYASPWVNKFFILNRSDYTAQAWSEAWARMSEVICEKVGWTADEVGLYYETTKSNFS